MKRTNSFVLPVFLALFTAVLSASRFNDPGGRYLPLVEENPVKEIEDGAFNKMMDVLTHQRCLNCHPSDNIPKQGDRSHPHYFGMARGMDNRGFEATNCTTCHQVANNDYSGVPGAPGWSLAPEKMRWEGLTRIEIANSMLNKENNGDRNQEEILHHLTEDPLVLWAWNPGVDAEGNPREKPPVPLEEFIDAVHEWFENGAIIPKK